MGVTLHWEGMNELREALRRLPDDLTAEAATIVDTSADLARGEVSSGYPTGPTGNLKRRVTVTHNANRRLSAVAVVKSAAPHASIFEKGTVKRSTRQGWNRGRMPQPPESQRAIPKFIRARQRMVQQLIALVRRAGFQVSER